MKREFRTFSAFLFTVFIFTGCEINIDYLHPNTHGQIGKYEIEKVTVKPPHANFTDTIRFTYNKYSNPVSGIRSEIRTGAPNYFFKYDKFQRMSELIAVYGFAVTDGVETWTKYTYDAKGRIIKDSVWIFPDVINGQPVKSQLGALDISLYEYDKKSRINKVTWLREGVEPYITEYTYDNNGNRVGNDYDNYSNYHLTNEIWMFLSRDYSVNNPLIGSYTYNNAGLPITIDCGEGSADLLMTAFVPISFTQATIKYDR